jgi:hypothetical protein
MVWKVIHGPEVRQTILDRLTSGETLTAICRTEGYPTSGCVIKWCYEDPDGYGKQYAKARQIGYTVMSDELIDLARGHKAGIKTKTKSDGTIETEEYDAVDRARLHVDTLKWFISKTLPKIYGPKTGDEDSDTQHTATGGLPD